MCTCCPALRASHSSAQRLTLPAVWLPPSGGLATPATGTCQPAPPACKLRPPFGILHSLVLPNVNCGAGVAVGRALTPRCVGPAALPPAAFIRAFISHPPRKQPVIYKCAGPTHRCGACISCPTCLAHERTVLAASPSRSPQFYPLPGRTCAAGACLPALLPSNAMSPPCVFSNRPPSSPPPSSGTCPTQTPRSPLATSYTPTRTGLLFVPLQRTWPTPCPPPIAGACKPEQQMRSSSPYPLCTNQSLPPSSLSSLSLPLQSANALHARLPGARLQRALPALLSSTAFNTKTTIVGQGERTVEGGVLSAIAEQLRCGARLVIRQSLGGQRPHWQRIFVAHGPGI